MIRHWKGLAVAAAALAMFAFIGAHGHVTYGHPAEMGEGTSVITAAHVAVLAHAARPAPAQSPAPRPVATHRLGAHLLHAYVAWRGARFLVRHLVLGRRFHILPWWMRG
jgi:hypothetical protein